MATFYVESGTGRQLTEGFDPTKTYVQSGTGQSFSGQQLTGTPTVNPNKDYYSTINSDLLSAQNPLNLPPPPRDDTNYGGIAATNQALLSLLGQQVQTPDTAGTYSKLYDQLGIQQATDRSVESSRQLGTIQAQLASLAAEANLIPTQIDQEFAGRGATKAGVAPIESSRLRDIALRSLPVQAQFYAQQAIAQADERALSAAQERLTTLYNIQSRQAELEYQAKKDQRALIYDYLSKSEQRQIDAKNTAEKNALDLKKMEIEQQYKLDFERFKNQFSASVGSNGQPLPSNVFSQVTGKPFSDSERTAQGYAQRASDSGSVIDELGSLFTGIKSYFGGILPNPLKTSERQRFEQAQRDFVNAVLRRESGAVISKDEFDNAKIQYFPQPGDSPETLQQKKQNRINVMNSLWFSGGVVASTVTGLPINGVTTGVTSSGLKWTITP